VFFKLLVSTVYYKSFVISTLVSIIKKGQKRERKDSKKKRSKKEREKIQKKVIEEQRNKN
jgi:hypothetical protein